MEYNDNRICNKKESQLISQKFTELEALEVQDLMELRDKMVQQKSMLIFANADGKLNKAISSTTSNIDSINRMISRISNNKPVIASTRKSLSRALNTNPDTYGKYPSQAEMDRMNRLNSTTQDNITIQPGNNTSSPTSNDSMDTANQVSATRKRRSPMRGSLLNTITRSLFIKNKAPQKMQIVADERKNRFHNGIDMTRTQFYSYTECNDCCDHDLHTHPSYHHCEPHHTRTDCDPHDKMVTGQIDLLRLLVLFISLHPHCGYSSKICGIASEQFDVLLNII